MIGVFSGMSSCFVADSILGVGGYSNGADGSPAEGRPAEYRPADGSEPFRSEAECGVRTDEADRRASEGRRASLGNLAEVGVARDGSFGLLVTGILTSWRDVEIYWTCEKTCETYYPGRRCVWATAGWTDSKVCV